jgi:hypothetical protein
MLGTTSFVFKIVKDEHEVFDTLLQYLDVSASFVFIELSNFSSSDDLTSGESSMKSPIMSFSQCLTSQLPQ